MVKSRYIEQVDVRQLQLLRELGELGSVSAVAEALYVTPSAVSQQLRLLQAGIAVPLTEKSGRVLTLTDAGRALAAAGADVELALARARAAVTAFTSDSGGTVTVCGFSSAAATFFPALLREHTGPNTPEVRVADEDVAQSEFPRLTSHYDLVVAHRLSYGPPWPRTMRVVPLLEEPLDVAVASGHPLATRTFVEPEDVAGEPWIAVHEGFPLGSTLTAIAASAGREIDVVHRVNDFPVVAELVAAGAGIALLPRWTTRSVDGVALLPLTGVNTNRCIDILTRPERAVRSATQAVIAALVTEARRISGT